MVLEVDVRGAGDQAVGDVRQSKIVGRDQADRPRIEQDANDGLRADTAIVGVRALEKFIEKEQQRRLSSGQIE